MCILASLFAGSASACACTHHAVETEKVETETLSCHSRAENAEHQQAEVDTDTVCFSSGDGCICVGNAERTATKSESIKLKKLVATIAPQALTENATSEPPDLSLADSIDNPLYLSDSFCASAPKRGPPRA